MPRTFAALGNVAALPWVNDKGRAAYETFLAHALPRAFVIGTAGESLAVFSGPDPLARAMATCANAHIECQPYAVDNDVVWVPPAAPATPRETHFAALGDVARVPWINDRSRSLYEKFLAAPLLRAFAIAPGGQAASTQGGFDPLGRALAKCREAGLECRAYAVDNRVVWSPPR